jgi:hypothetical protein
MYHVMDPVEIMNPKKIGQFLDSQQRLARFVFNFSRHLAADEGIPNELPQLSKPHPFLRVLDMTLDILLVSLDQLKDLFKGLPHLVSLAIRTSPLSDEKLRDVSKKEYQQKALLSIQEVCPRSLVAVHVGPSQNLTPPSPFLDTLNVSTRAPGHFLCIQISKSESKETFLKSLQTSAVKESFKGLKKTLQNDENEDKRSLWFPGQVIPEMSLGSAALHSTFHWQ